MQDINWYVGSLQIGKILIICMILTDMYDSYRYVGYLLICKIHVYLLMCRIFRDYHTSFGYRLKLLHQPEMLLSAEEL